MSDLDGTYTTFGPGGVALSKGRTVGVFQESISLAC